MTTHSPNPLESHGGLLRPFSWLVVLIVCYFLSVGPAMVVYARGRGFVLPQSSGWVVGLYVPVWRVYWNTPLQKPLGMYLHLWAPNCWAKDGGYQGG